MSKRNFFAGVVGNVLEHYDNALFGLLAPFISPLFFPESSPIAALILTYGMGMFGLLSKPLGAVFFGYLGDKYGRKRSLSITLIGMAIVTCLMGALPSYAQVGVFAPIVLALCRFMQSFFSAGERAGGAILVLESSAAKDKSFLSSLYDSSSMLGIFLASAVVGLLCAKGGGFWRVPFFLGSLCGVCGIVLRLFSEEPLSKREGVSLRGHFRDVWSHRKVIVQVAIAAGFSYCTYSFSFTLMNGLLPFVSDFSKESAIRANTVLLILDFALLPLFGFLATKVSKERLMAVAALATAICAIPLYSLLGNASMLTAVCVRVGIVTLGVAFAAPYHHWAQERVPQEVRYTVTAFAKALGAKLIGLPCVIVSLSLYQSTGWAGAPGIYLMGVGLLAFAAVGARFLTRTPHRGKASPQSLP